MNIPIPQIKNLDIQTIIGAIAAIIAAVGLIGGVTTSSTNDQAGSSDSTSVNNEPREVREFRAAVKEFLEAQGYTITAEANRQAKASAEGYYQGNSYQYDSSKFRASQQVVAPAYFPEMTSTYKSAAAQARAEGHPKGSRGEAGIGIVYDIPQSSIVILAEHDE